MTPVIFSILVAGTLVTVTPAFRLPQEQIWQPTVQTTSGRLSGLRQSLANDNSTFVHKFLSVPYALAPSGKLRFKEPRSLPLEAASLARDASRLGPTCPQFRHIPQFVSPLLNVDPEHRISEDCLHLHIYSPASAGPTNSTSGKLPVIVWIPGEGFDFADARQFDGSQLASRTNSLVVVVQYRVGVLGFLQAPELGAPGNMGLRDQLAALRWVHDNAAAFGADPSRVTLMGRFSGSMSISALIAAPERDLLASSETGKPLFNRVGMLSGIAVPDWIIETRNQHEQRLKHFWSQLADGLCANQTGSDCLTSEHINMERLIQAAGYGWRLTVDDQLVGSAAPVDAAASLHPELKLEAALLGQTATEGSLCLYRHLLDQRNRHYANLIDSDRLTPGDLYEMLRNDSLAYFSYQLAPADRPSPILSAIADLSQERHVGLRERYLSACSAYMVKDHTSRWRRNILARNMDEQFRTSQARPVDVLHYELKYRPSFSQAPDYIKTAAHGDDIPLIFGLLYNRPAHQVSPADLEMTRRMMRYVSDFVHARQPETINSTNQNQHLTEFEFAQGDQPHVSHHQHQHQQQISADTSGLEPVGLILVPSTSQKSRNLASMLQPQQRTPLNDLFYLVPESGRRPIAGAASTSDEGYLRSASQERPDHKHAQTMILVNEASLLKMFVFGSCVPVLALISLCLFVGLLIYRGQGTSKGAPGGGDRHFYVRQRQQPSDKLQAEAHFAVDGQAASRCQLLADGLGGACNLCVSERDEPDQEAAGQRGVGRKDCRKNFCNMFLARAEPQQQTPNKTDQH